MLHKLGRGPLDDATYQIPRLYALWFQTRRIKKFSSRKSNFSLCYLDMQQTGTILTIIKEGHIRIFPAKFGKTQSVIYKEMSFEAIFNVGRQMAHD